MNDMNVTDLTLIPRADLAELRFAPTEIRPQPPLTYRFAASSNLYSAGYVGGVLWVRFLINTAPSPDIYTYDGLTVGVYYGLITADSAGKYFASNVRTVPVSRKVNGVEVGSEWAAVLTNGYVNEVVEEGA